jgi:hypothetical protein
MGFERMMTDNAKTVVEQFSALAKEIVCKFASECKKKNVLPTYPNFELWMNQNSGDLAEEPSCFS